MQCIFFLVESGIHSKDPMELAELIEQNILTLYIYDVVMMFRNQCTGNQISAEYAFASRKYAFIILTPLNPTFL